MNRLASLTRQQQIVAAVAAVFALVLGAVVAAAASGGGHHAAAAKPIPVTRPTTTARPTTTVRPTTTTTRAPKPALVAPLTGLPPSNPLALLRPALAVKIDNLDAPSESAVPQRGLNRADVVFEEIVEGDITRLVAVFHSQWQDTVGPVRSARTTDVHMLPQLQRPLIAWSGGNAGVSAAVRNSPLRDVGADAVPGGYFRDGSRRAPHNLYARPDVLWGAAPAGAGTPVPLFTYLAKGEVPKGLPAAGVDLVWGSGSASTPAGWRWDPGSHQYLRTQRGRPHIDATDGQQVSATNVVVLNMAYGEDGNRSPEALTVGSGDAYVLTQGKVIACRWWRPDENGPTRLVGADGAPVKLTPGRTWEELPKPGGATIIT
ncbi:MAG: hypothetical protein JWN46_1578 [Acidimicrobiales bacterium]|nr:hypothetical protein [Acidimicrobiales bacterium]